MKKRLICILLSFSLLMMMLTIRISKNYRLSCDIFADNGIKGHIATDINNLLLKKINADNDIFNCKNIIFKSDGSISQIEVNTNEINKLCNEISKEIFQLIINRKDTYGIPMGNLTGYAFLSGKGPKIKVNVSPIGNVEYKINSELLSSGINQSLHRITVEFYVEIQCLAPFYKARTEIELPIVLSETLIVGAVPEVLFSS